MWNCVQTALFAVRGAAGERFFGAPLWAFQNARPLEQMWVELAVIAVGIVTLAVMQLRKAAQPAAPAAPRLAGRG